MSRYLIHKVYHSMISAPFLRKSQKSTASIAYKKKAKVALDKSATESVKLLVSIG